MDFNPSLRFGDGDIVSSRDGASNVEHAYFVGRLLELRQFRFNTYERALAVAQALVVKGREAIPVTDECGNLVSRHEVPRDA